MTKVLSYNEETKENEYKKVDKLLIPENLKEDLYTLTIDDLDLKVTDAHRLYILRTSHFGLLEVEDNHNYYVSDKEILVHNAKVVEDPVDHPLD